MKVTVTKYLNVRVGKASLNAPCYQYLAPGSELEVDGKLYEGDVYDGNDQWYKDEAGNYYWSGGVKTSEVKVINSNTLSEKKFDWWHEKFDIPKVWELLGTQGEGTRVTVIDSGLDPNSEYFKYTDVDGTGVVDEKYIDTFGHGTCVASIICGNGDSFIGIAPQASLYVIKFYNSYPPKPSDLIKALEKVPKDSASVVISSGFLKQDITNEEFEQMNKAIKSVSEHSLVICSVGDDYNHDDNPFQRYPSAYQETLSIASINEQGEISLFSTKSSKVSLSAPGENVKMININNKLSTGSGTSFSAPFIAGLVALIKSKHKNYKPSDIAEKLISHCEPKKDQLLYGAGIINPIKTIKQL